MNVVFAGTSEFAATALFELIQSHHKVQAVYTQPDKPAGRGLKLTESPVKILAQRHQLPLFQPTTLKDSKEEERVASLKPEAMVVAAYGILIPPALLRLPAKGCVNIHPSLLPRWRGAAPIERSIFYGDKETGVTIMQMDQGLDTGPILLQERCPIDEEDTARTLHERLAKVGAKLLIRALNLLAENKLLPTPQNSALATYANKISKEEALLDWVLPADELARMIRAFVPWPVAYTSWQSQPLRIWQAETQMAINGTPREILMASKKGIDVATGKGALRLLQVQLPGGKVLSAEAFYNGHREKLKVGQHFV